MKLFVTGSTGFIGSHFLNEALKSGHEILSLQRSAASCPRITLEETHALRWLVKGMTDVESKDLEGCDAIVHLAAHSANVPYDSLENCIYWNVLVPLGLFRKAIAAGIARFIIAGSCFEYGRSGERYDFIPPDAPLEPTNSYAASKAASSIAFSQLAIEFGMQLSIQRIFQVYGEGESEDRFWPTLRRCALKGEDFKMTLGEQIRDFSHVKDVASLLLKECELAVKSGEPRIKNLGSGRHQTLRAFAEHWWREWGGTGELKIGALLYRNNEVMRYLPQLDYL